jgi:hypothetical protein
MKLKELKDWLNGLPNTYDEYDVVNGEYGKFSEDDEDLHYRMDKPIIASIVDVETNEVVLLHRFSEDGFE